jgi:hypothetical protein
MPSAALHAGIHLARYFWVVLVLTFGCCLGKYLRHQKISMQEVANIKYLEPRRAGSLPVGAAVPSKQPDLEVGSCAGGS